MDNVPVELITLIAEHADDATLQALVKTSRKVHTGSFPTFGDRFFRNIKFCLYANSLQVLTDISYTPRLVGFVRTVAFGNEEIGLIDPIHDIDVRQGNVRHSSSGIPVSEALDSTRARVDAAIISQALIRFPKLAMVVIGRKFMLDGHELPRAKCASQLVEFTCPSGHCVSCGGLRSVFSIYLTISLALQRMGNRFRHVKIGMSLHDDIDITPEVRRMMAEYYPQDEVSQSVTNLQLTLSATETGFRDLGIHDLVENATIDTLEVQYMGANSYAHDEIHVMTMKLPTLKRVVLKSLCAKPSAYEALLRIHGSRLTEVSLEDCSTSEPFSYPGQAPWQKPLFPLQPMATQWISILHLFRDCDKLVFLQLERLQIWCSPLRLNPVDITQHVPGVDQMDERMTLCGKWQGKEEIARGLQALHGQDDRLIIRKPSVLFTIPQKPFALPRQAPRHRFPTGTS